MGVQHRHPDWAKDGHSILGMLRTGPGAASQPRAAPLCFQLGPQTACVDNDLKAVQAPSKGQCDWNDDGQPPSYLRTARGSKHRVFVFNLTADPTESRPLADKAIQAKYAAMLQDFRASTTKSAQTESLCAAPGK